MQDSLNTNNTDIPGTSSKTAMSPGPIEITDLSQSLVGPLSSHFSIMVVADLSSLERDAQNLAVEAALFSELDSSFGTVVARDVLAGFAVDDSIGEAVTAVVQKHVSPDMIDLTSGLLGVFGSVERESAAQSIIELIRSKDNEWQPVTVDGPSVAKYVNGFPYKPYMPVGNSFVHDLTQEEDMAGSDRTVLPNYRMIIRAWKA